MKRLCTSKNWRLHQNLKMKYYLHIGDLDQVEKYVYLIENSDRLSEEDIAKAHLYSAQALLKKGDKAFVMK